MVVRPHRFESRCTCVRFAWSAYLQNVVFHKHLSAILVTNLYHLAFSNLQKGTVLLNSTRARVARECYARERYAACRHLRHIRVCRHPPAASNIDRTDGQMCNSSARTHGAGGAELRENVTCNKACCLWHRMTHLSPQTTNANPRSRNLRRFCSV